MIQAVSKTTAAVPTIVRTPSLSLTNTATTSNSTKSTTLNQTKRSVQSVAASVASTSMHTTFDSSLTNTKGPAVHTSTPVPPPSKGHSPQTPGKSLRKKVGVY